MWFLAIEGCQGLQEGTVDGRRVSLGQHSKAGDSLQGPPGFFIKLNVTGIWETWFQAKNKEQDHCYSA